MVGITFDLIRRKLTTKNERIYSGDDCSEMTKMFNEQANNIKTIEQNGYYAFANVKGEIQRVAVDREVLEVARNACRY